VAYTTNNNDHSYDFYTYAIIGAYACYEYESSVFLPDELNEAVLHYTPQHVAQCD